MPSMSLYTSLLALAVFLILSSAALAQEAKGRGLPTRELEVVGFNQDEAKVLYRTYSLYYSDGTPASCPDSWTYHVLRLGPEQVRGPFEVSGFPGGDNDPSPGENAKYDAVVPHYDQSLKKELPRGWTLGVETLRQWGGGEQRLLRMSLGHERGEATREVRVRGAGKVRLRAIHRLPGQGIVFAEVEVEHEGAREPILVGFQWRPQVVE